MLATHQATHTKAAYSKPWAITVTLNLHLPNAAGATELATGPLSLVGAATTALKFIW
jgi:hypothetical protein